MDAREWRIGKRDVVSGLTAYVVLLVAVPARQVLEPLGAAGTPATLFGLALVLMWFVLKTVNGDATRCATRAGLHAYAVAVLVSYVAAMRRPIASVEVRAADRGLITLVALCGVALVASEMIPSRARLELLLQRLCTAAAALAGVGLVQFFTGFDVAKRVNFPGLQTIEPYTSVLARDGFRRPSATAIHPIEFGVVLALILPLAIHYAWYPGRRGGWWRVLLIAAALPASLSRSALLGAVVVLVVLVPTWPRTRQWGTIAALPVFALILKVMVPGLLGTMRNLFTGLFGDTSTLSRTGSYDLAGHYISQSPAFGRGIDTFLPSYRILDNQYLLTAIELGLFGLVALCVLFGVALASARRARAAAADAATADLARSLAASVAVAVVTFATFDALSYTMVSGVTFLVIGTCGALSRLSADRPRPIAIDGRVEQSLAVAPG